VRKDKDNIEKGKVSRRDFLVGAGAVVATSAVGSMVLAGCGGGTETVTVTQTKTVPTTVTSTVGGGGTVTSTVTSTVGGGGTVTSTVPGGTVTVTKTVSDGGGAVEPAFEPEETFFMVAGPSCGEIESIDYKHGRVIRTRPTHWNEKYTDAELTALGLPWKYDTAKHRKTGQTVVYQSWNRSMPSYLSVPYKKRVYSPRRILKPLQRVDWEPGGDPAKINTKNRGISKFKEISWDKAIEIVASEIKRIHDKYGVYGILEKGDSVHRESKNLNSGNARYLLYGCGGYTMSVRNPDSWEGYYYGSSFVWGMGNNGFLRPNNLQTIDLAENCDMVVYQGCDWDTTNAISGGFPSRVCRWYKKLGIKAIYLSPDVNWQCTAHPDKWIPIIPSRDDALQCAIIWVWLKEDTWNKDYVATHAIGMDYIEDYIMGRIDDKIEKTPAWAAPRTGIPEWTIKALARQWAAKRTSTMHNCGGAYIRNPYSHECARWEAVMLGMQGLGAPGIHQSGDYMGQQSPYTNMPGGYSTGGNGLASRASVFAGIYPQTQMAYPCPQKQLVAKTRVADAILTGKMEQYGSAVFRCPLEDFFIKYVYPIPADQGGTRFHMIWQDHCCMTGCWCYSNKYVHALRDPSIEFHMIQHQWMEKDTHYADIVLPARTNYEDEDMQGAGMEVKCVIYRPECITTVGEAKGDQDIQNLIAAKLETYGGRYTGLLNILMGGKTHTGWAQYGWENSTQKGLMTWDQFKEKRMVIQPVPQNFYTSQTRCLKKFYDDPEANPLVTGSGKLDFYSQMLAENSPDDTERKPYPRYLCGGPDPWPLDESLDVQAGAQRCKKYPLVMQSQHNRWREQSQMDDVTWLREIKNCKVKCFDGYLYEPLWIHPIDAAKRGIKHGDIVKVWNERGVELGGAYVTERIIPNAVHMDHSANIDFISHTEEDWDARETKWVNRGGTVNQICPDYNKSKYLGNFMVVSGYLVEVAKVTGDEYLAWKEKYPASWAKEYDDSGVTTNAWIQR